MSDADKHLVTGDTMPDVIKLASKHDIAHLVAFTTALSVKLIDTKI